MFVKKAAYIIAAAGLCGWAISGCSHSESDTATPPPLRATVQGSRLPAEQKEVVQAKITAAQQAAEAQSRALSAQHH